MAIPPGRRYQPDEPPWMREVCRKGHILRVHGVPRSDHKGVYCRECKRLWRRARRERDVLEGITARQRASPSNLRPPAETFPDELDEVVIHRLTKGQHSGHASGEERFEAVRQLYGEGVSITRTAELVHLHIRTVIRHRVKIKKGIPYGQAG